MLAGALAATDAGVWLKVWGYNIKRFGNAIKSGSASWRAISAAWRRFSWSQMWSVSKKPGLLKKPTTRRPPYLASQVFQNPTWAYIYLWNLYMSIWTKLEITLAVFSVSDLNLQTATSRNGGIQMNEHQWIQINCGLGWNVLPTKSVTMFVLPGFHLTM